MLTVSDNHIVLGGGGGGGGGGSTTFAGLCDKATADIPAINTPLATALDAKEATSNKKTDVDANKTSDTFFPSVKAVFDWVSGLFVKGAVSSADNAVAVWDGVTGKILKNSGVSVLADGRMGIGTASPEQNLHISSPDHSVMLCSGGWSGRVRLAATLSTTNNRNFEFSSRDGMFLFSSLNDGWSAYNSASILALKSGGEVGVGTSEPTQKLHVSGNIRVTGAYYDSTNSPGTNGQVLKNVGGLPVWSNP